MSDNNKPWTVEGDGNVRFHRVLTLDELEELSRTLPLGGGVSVHRDGGSSNDNADLGGLSDDIEYLSEEDRRDMALNTVKQALADLQQAMRDFIEPVSRVEEDAFIGEVLGIVDHRDLVQAQDVLGWLPPDTTA